MKRIITVSITVLSIVGAANASVYIGNPDTPTADWNNWLNTMTPETAAAVNNLATAVNANAAEFDGVHNTVAAWNKLMFGPNGDMSSGLFHNVYNVLLPQIDENSNAFGQVLQITERLDNNIHHINKELSAGIANVAALSSVAVFDVKQGEISLGGGYGYHNSQSAVAFGGAVGLTDNWSMNAGVGFNDFDVTVRAGTNVRFKLF